jgi:hypothetical protein
MPFCSCAALAFGILDQKTPPAMTVIRNTEINIEGNSEKATLPFFDFIFREE